MPNKDPEAHKAYQRQWRAEHPDLVRATRRRHYEANREAVKADAAKLRRETYGGICENCGGPTVGRSKSEIPRFCSKSECISARIRRYPWGYWPERDEAASG